MSRPRVAIVDTGSGNLRSVEKALAVAGADAHGHRRSRRGGGRRQDRGARPGRVRRLRGRPGPRRRGAARRRCWSRCARASRTWGCAWGCRSCSTAATNRPTVAGLGIIPGRVRRFEVKLPDKIPHMGWNEVRRGPAAGGPRAGRPRPTARISTSCTATTRRRRTQARRGAVLRLRRALLRGRGPGQRAGGSVPPRKEPGGRHRPALTFHRERLNLDDAIATSRSRPG